VQNDKQKPGAGSGPQNASALSKPGPNGHSGSAAGVTAWQNAHWQHSQVSGLADKSGHTWNGQPQAGAFDRYKLPANVTGAAGLAHVHQQPPSVSGGAVGTTSGFTKYVISGNPGNAQLGSGKGAAPQWLAQGTSAGSASQPRWLTQGSAANVPQPVQQTVATTGAVGPKGVAPPPVTPQQVTAAIKQAAPPAALQQISAAVKGTSTPLWLSQGSAAAVQVKGVQPGTQQNGSQQNGSQQSGSQQTATPPLILKK